MGIYGMCSRDDSNHTHIHTLTFTATTPLAARLRPAGATATTATTAASDQRCIRPHHHQLTALGGRNGTRKTCKETK